MQRGLGGGDKTKNIIDTDKLVTFCTLSACPRGSLLREGTLKIITNTVSTSLLTHEARMPTHIET